MTFGAPTVGAPTAVSARDVDLSMFGTDPWWLVIAKAIVIFAFLVLTTLVLILAERKVMAWMQMRVGPDRSVRKACSKPSPTASNSVSRKASHPPESTSRSTSLHP